MTKRASWIAWFWLVLGVLYLLFPLLATLQFSLQATRGVAISFTAYVNALSAPDFVDELPVLVAHGADHDSRQHAADRPDGLLGQPAPAFAAPGHRVPDAAALRHPAGGAGLRADPQLQRHVADQQQQRRLHAHGRRIRHALVPLQLPGDRHRAAIDQRARADRSGAEPGRGLADDPVSRHLPQHLRGGSERRVHHLRAGDGRVHDCLAALAADLWSLHERDFQPQGL